VLTKDLPLNVQLTGHLQTCTYFTFTYNVALVTFTDVEFRKQTLRRTVVIVSAACYNVIEPYNLSTTSHYGFYGSTYKEQLPPSLYMETLCFLRRGNLYVKCY